MRGDGQRIAAGCSDGTVRVWDASTGVVVVKVEGRTGRVWSVTWGGDNGRFASGGDDSTVRVWDTSGTTLCSLKGHSGDAPELKLSICWFIRLHPKRQVELRCGALHNRGVGASRRPWRPLGSFVY